MIVTASGHRPENFHSDRNFAYSSQCLYRIVDLAIASLRVLEPTLVFDGLAEGWDTAIALACVQLSIPFVAAIPFEGQELKWSKWSQELYCELRSKAIEEVIVCPGDAAKWKYQKRNVYMVDEGLKRAQQLQQPFNVLTCWDGSKGGTHNCLAYAEGKGIKPINVWSSWQKHNNLLNNKFSKN